MLDAGLIAPSGCAPCRRDTCDDAKLLGVYDFVHRGGTFQVHLRAGGHFYAPNFPTKSLWMTMPGKDHKLLIQWKEYGSYALNMISPMPSFHGSEVNKPDNWRQMSWRRPFTLHETKLMDSEWEFEHPGGHFLIEFRADGRNSFVCAGFPAQAFWRLDDAESEVPTVYINWGKYGEYELRMAPDGASMEGSAKGQPDNWRKAFRLRGLGEHAKKRDRGENCGGCKKGCNECGRGDD